MHGKKVIYIVGPERIHTIFVDAQKEYDEKKPAVDYEHWSRDLKIKYDDLKEKGHGDHFAHSHVVTMLTVSDMFSLFFGKGHSTSGYHPLSDVVIYAETYVSEQEKRAAEIVDILLGYVEGIIPEAYKLDRIGEKCRSEWIDLIAGVIS